MIQLHLLKVLKHLVIYPTASIVATKSWLRERTLPTSENNPRRFQASTPTPLSNNERRKSTTTEQG